jgi:uncharacterized membrane protein
MTMVPLPALERSRRWVEDGSLAATLIVGALAWAALIPLAAWARSVEPGPLVGSVVDGVYRFGSLVCHQLPSRSFAIEDTTLPVCARCTGIYAGAALAAVLAVGRRRTNRSRPSPFPPATARLLLGLAAAPTVITIAAERLSGAMPGHATRAVAGAVLGGAVGWVILALVSPSRSPRTGGGMR